MNIANADEFIIGYGGMVDKREIGWIRILKFGLVQNLCVDSSDAM